eukprot:maker-scaffold526_size146413-snap-gene-0.27 protein:Tk11268 transcript:maker-scaffold526_size146413-snap-gene-0.27-mRNA-1 annotation:"15-hydroxyprostaglandin dehydrogenase"
MQSASTPERQSASTPQRQSASTPERQSPSASTLRDAVSLCSTLRDAVSLHAPRCNLPPRPRCKPSPLQDASHPHSEMQAIPTPRCKPSPLRDASHPHSEMQAIPTPRCKPSPLRDANHPHSEMQAIPTPRCKEQALVCLEFAFGHSTGNVAIVTGGSQGFGKEFTRQLLKHGAKVCLSDVNSDIGLATETELKKEFGQENVCFVKADVTSDEDWTNLWNKTEEKLGAVSILVNNAGVGPKTGWEKNVDIMVKGVAKGTFLGLKRMGKNMSGRIINISSFAGITSGLESSIETCGYPMAKHAVISLTRSFAVANPAPFQKYGVKSYAICPWFADTQLLRSELTEGWTRQARSTGTRVLTSEEVGETLITILKKDKNGACFFVFPDIPLVEFPNSNEALLAFAIVAGQVLTKLGYKTDILPWPMVLSFLFGLFVIFYLFLELLKCMIW